MPFGSSMSALFSTVTPLQAALDYHLQRHNVLVANVAHVDTPGYVPKDVERVDTQSFQGMVDVAMARTSPAHLAAGVSMGAGVGRIIEDPAPGAGMDGNSVSLDREAAKVAANQSRYDVVATLVTSELASLSFAASDGRG
jgi:flagellar basal-body rod protein FlgB